MPAPAHHGRRWVIPHVNAKPVANELITKLGSVSAALGPSPERLMEVKDGGDSAAAFVRAANLLMQQSARDEVVERPVMSNWAVLLN